MLAEWFERERGIRLETLVAFGARFEGEDTVVLPYSVGEKTRKFLPDGKRKFNFTPGVQPPLYVIGCEVLPVRPEEPSPMSTTFLVEGETDTMRLWQELREEGSKAQVFGLSGINAWRPEMAASFEQADRVYVIFDNDDYSNKTAVEQVEATWRNIRSDLKGKATRIKLPSGVKDLCEFFDGYDLNALRTLTTRNGPTVSRYRPLDLQSEPPPIHWLVEGLIAKGDVTLLMGDSGLGKSWSTMALTLGVAQGSDMFLGLPLLDHGRVLYCDEENPADVVFDRLRRLGLTAAGAKQIRYLHNEGIRLDRNASEFLEEALEYEPTLIVLDSLTRFHVQDENSAGAMSGLYNDGIKPLARETGAAVVLIHHAGKSDGPSLRRSRGSSDIVAAVDAAIDLRQVEPFVEGAFYAKQFKSRRRKGGDGLTVQIRDVEGAVVLDAVRPLDPPF